MITAPKGMFVSSDDLDFSGLVCCISAAPFLDPKSVSAVFKDRYLADTDLVNLRVGNLIITREDESGEVFFSHADQAYKIYEFRGVFRKITSDYDYRAQLETINEILREIPLVEGVTLASFRYVRGKLVALVQVSGRPQNARWVKDFLLLCKKPYLRITFLSDATHHIKATLELPEMAYVWECHTGRLRYCNHEWKDPQ